MSAVIRGQDWLGNEIHETDLIAYPIKDRLVTARVVSVDQYSIWVRRTDPRQTDRQRNFISLPHGSVRYILLSCSHGQVPKWSP